MFEIETTVLGGFPVEVRYDLQAADPSVGIFGETVDDVSLYVRGKRAIWLENKLSQLEWDRLFDKIVN